MTAQVESHDKGRPSAEVMHPEVFRVLDDLIERLHQWIDRDIPDVPTPSGVVTISVILRAFNQYRAIVNLLRTNHWEDALILTRSLFELLLNAEEILRYNAGLEAACARFLDFYELQQYLHWREDILYNIQTGRLPAQFNDRVARLDTEARKRFRAFWHLDKKGRGRWRHSWCNRDVAGLSEASDNALRPYQYRILYAWGSQFSHSTPMVVFAATHLVDKPLDQEDFDKWIHDLEEGGLRNVAMLAATFILEILYRLGDRLPECDPRFLLEATKDIREKIGRVPPGTFLMPRPL